MGKGMNMKPMLTEWKREGTFDAVREWNPPLPGGYKLAVITNEVGWTIWGGDFGGHLIAKGDETGPAGEATADKAARQWYTLPEDKPRTYDIKDIKITFGGIEIKGLPDMWTPGEVLPEVTPKGREVLGEWVRGLGRYVPPAPMVPLVDPRRTAASLCLRLTLTHPKARAWLGAETHEKLRYLSSGDPSKLHHSSVIVALHRIDPAMTERLLSKSEAVAFQQAYSALVAVCR